MTNGEVLQPTRELINGVYYCVHVSRDGRLRVNTGPDDQRPDHDGHEYFQPICVAEVSHWALDDDASVWTYHKYCGSCRKRMGRLGEIKERCPRCGKGIAHYVFAMGVERYKRRDWDDGMPDVWPVATVSAIRPALPSRRKELSA